MSALLKRLRANRASDKLVAAVVKQSHGRGAAERRGAAAARAVRRSGRDAQAEAARRHSLYDLPWYVIIGAPGSGKTTALVNSGLQFPLEQRSGQRRAARRRRHAQLRLVVHRRGGVPRHRRPLHDAGLRRRADSAGWVEFLALLRKYRKRRPVNGVILDDQRAGPDDAGRATAREAHVAAARRRLNELNRELRIQLPVYLMVTKCDLVAGFTEYFDDLDAGRPRAGLGRDVPVRADAQGRGGRGLPGGVRRADRRG